VIKGEVRRIPGGPGLKVPHTGWNSVSIKQGGGIFSGVPNGSYFYFVHSYYVTADDPGCVAAQSEYGVVMDSAVQKGTLSAVQFHPEKSGAVGLKILKNFVRQIL